MRRFAISPMMLMLLLPTAIGADEPLGVVANANTNSIQLINPLTQEIGPSLLKGELGSYEGGLRDVRITSDGHTAIVNNWGDNTLLFIDISGGFAGQAAIKGSVSTSMPVMSMAITPDDRYLLLACADLKVKSVGMQPAAAVPSPFNASLAVVDMRCMELIRWKPIHGLPIGNIAITPNGKTVFLSLLIGWGSIGIDSYSLSEHGDLQWLESTRNDPITPLYLAVSPDGRTLIAADPRHYYAPVYQIANDGHLALQSLMPVPRRGGNGCIFSADGRQAFLLTSTQSAPEILSTGTLLGHMPAESGKAAAAKLQVHVLDVHGPGQVDYSGHSIPVSIDYRTSFPEALLMGGAVGLALSPSGQHLYITNAFAPFNEYVFFGVVEVAVIDLAAQAEIAPLAANGIPTGIAFTTVKND